ncbi:MAG: hypothetical protein H0W78_17870 [Planctomycetes bacterium]|jgi:hypothetical protein|nr:hypothetical protein [Planctomycetota bacterium]
MSALHHLLHRSTGAIALALAFAVLVGSLCPRGWFVCVHAETVALVDEHHAQDGSAGQACGEHDCCPHDSDGCLDLALSLVLDDQTAAWQVWGALPSGAVLATVPDLSSAAGNAWASAHQMVGGPPPSPFVVHIRLLV